MTILLCLMVLAVGAVRVLARQKRRRQPTPPRPAVSPVMQQKMARTLTTLITAGGTEKWSQARTMAKGYGLRSSTFQALAVPPEEDGARESLIGWFR